MERNVTREVNRTGQRECDGARLSRLKGLPKGQRHVATHLCLALDALVARQRGLVALLLLLRRPTRMTLGQRRVSIMGGNPPIVEPTYASGASAADARQTKIPGHGHRRRDGGVGHGAGGQRRRAIAASDSYGATLLAVALLEKRQVHPGALLS
ncbi:hypothetical protein TARUN_1781 [Trichoderma arundinaceum]|uniref:Uncharacterized protein n=1 Tax=Trichoderma arundinaceum TaxID=490622 RepID=A0A395NWE8_TRIAR|nr:hypothetical protein TARUN_1781 [Trichoderma arundinaceum]